MKKSTKLPLVLTCLSSIFLSGQTHAASVAFTNPDSNVNSSYNRAGAVNFVKRYAAKPGYTVSPYTTYGDETLGGDCTNFASQVIHLGGGLPFHGEKGYNRNTVDWYYYGPNVPPATEPRTSSWTGAHQFREHWGVINGVGGKYAYMMRIYTKKEAPSYYNEIYSALENGDVVQYVDGSGTTTHSQVVWNYSNGTMNVAQHSTTSGYWGLDLGLKTELENRRYDSGWVCVISIKRGI